MTATIRINPKKYARLLAKTLPVVIETEEENERMLEMIEPLFNRKDLSPEESRLFDLLVKLIQDFEDKHYNLNAATPLAILRSLMESRGLRPKDLWEVIGSKSRVSEILSGKRAISKVHARRLAQFFNVSADLFI